MSRNPEVDLYLETASFIGGIPLNFKEIANNYKGNIVVPSVSGQSIRISVGEQRISIGLAVESELDETVAFGAELLYDEKNRRLIDFHIRTRERDTGLRHPDFYAKRLASAAIAYFSQDKELDGVKFFWLGYSDNYKRYIELKEQYLKDAKEKNGFDESEVEEQAKKDAALGTWTGINIAQEPGFSQAIVRESVDPIDEENFDSIEGDCIEGVFYRQDIDLNGE